MVLLYIYIKNFSLFTYIQYIDNTYWHYYIHIIDSSRYRVSVSERWRTLTICRWRSWESVHVGESAPPRQSRLKLTSRSSSRITLVYIARQLTSISRFILCIKSDFRSASRINVFSKPSHQVKSNSATSTENLNRLDDFDSIESSNN